MGKILIIGSNGFIGSHLSAYLKEKGFDIYGCGTAAESLLNIKYFQVDSLNPDYPQILKQVECSAIINCSGAANVPDSFKTPESDFTLNTANVMKQLEAMRKAGSAFSDCTYLNISSAAVYGNPAELPIKEDAKLSPVSPYGFHKLCAETICNEYRTLYGLKVSSLRVFSAYGPGLRKQIFYDIAKKTMYDSEIHVFGTGNEIRDYIHIKDICHAIYLLISSKKALPPVINIANGVQVPVKNVVDEIKSALGSGKKVVFSEHNRTGDPLYWQADITVLQQFGYKQTVSLKDGVKEYIEWLKKAEK
ncbi:MAG: SDR family oxidoreductase [Spirochaetales bacterium]|nr:SDR family oxidoreductase [Spirochaetales bacterium]